MSNSFYTSVERQGNNILWAGYEKGKRFYKKVPFQPTFYLPTKQETENRSLIGGEYLKPHTLENMREARDFIEKYKDVSGMKIHGTSNYVTQFIQEKYPSTIAFDVGLMNIVSFDIEVDIANGLKLMRTYENEITSISYKSSRTNEYHLLGRKDYDKYATLIENLDPETDIIFQKFDSEMALLRRFVQIWSNDYPDVVTGWNCVPVGQSVWGKDGIYEIENVPDTLYEIENVPDTLYGSSVVNRSPISMKEKYTFRLENGMEVHSSKDHKFFVRYDDGAFGAEANNDVLTGEQITRSGRRNLYMFVPVNNEAPEFVPADISPEQAANDYRNRVYSVSNANPFTLLEDGTLALDVVGLSKLGRDWFDDFQSYLSDSDYSIFTHNQEDSVRMLELMHWYGVCGTIEHGVLYELEMPDDDMLDVIDCGGYWSEVMDAYATGEVTPMMDIETTDESFISRGIRVHNCKFFDITYIVKRITKLFGEDYAKKLSPWGKIDLKTEKMFNREQETYKIFGMSVVDMMDAFKKFGYKYGKQESYKLDHISMVVLGEKKVDYSEYKDLTDLYERNPQLYLDYSLKDTVLLQRIEDETGLIALVIQVAFGAGANFDEAFGTVAPWESILYRWQRERGLVPEVKGGAGGELGELVGGYVKDPKIGFSEWVVSLDLNSLYPHLMLQYNMSPETYVDGDRVYCTPDMILDKKFENFDGEYARAANGVAFRKDERGMIPTIIKGYYARRKDVKKEMLNAENELEKIKEAIARKKSVA